MKILKYILTLPKNGGDEMRVMRTFNNNIVWKPGFQNHHDNKAKGLFFNLFSCSCSKILDTFLCSFRFPNSQFYGYLTPRSSQDKSFKSDSQDKSNKSLDLEAGVEKSISFIFR